MMVSYAAAALVAVLLQSLYWRSLSQAQDCLAPVAPSHGDLWLLPGNDSERLVMIYMGPDGTDDQKMWGTLNGYHTVGNVAETLCYQLGYVGKAATAMKSPEGYDIGSSSVWLSNIQCPGQEDPQEKHILRCNSTFHDPKPDHNNDIHLNCSLPLVSNLDTAYIGQGRLLPPVEVPANKCKRSVSYGAVIFKHNKVWNYIRRISSTLTLNATDTICREIGFTHSVRNSLMTVGQTGDVYDLGNVSYVYSENFICPASYQCIGCCFNLSSSFTNLKRTVNDTAAVVLRCSFFSPVNHGISPATSGYRKICEKVEHESVCPSSASDPPNYYALPFKIVVPVLCAALCVIGVLFLAKVALRQVRNRLRHREYFPAPERETAGTE